MHLLFDVVYPNLVNISCGHQQGLKLTFGAYYPRRNTKIKKKKEPLRLYLHFMYSCPRRQMTAALEGEMEVAPLKFS